MSISFSDSVIHSIKQTIDGGYIAVGGTRTSDENLRDCLVILKLDSNGNVLWKKVYSGSGADVAYSVIQISDGYIVGGITTSFGAGEVDFLILKLDSNGNIQWQKTYGGPGSDILQSISVVINLLLGS